MPHNADRNGSPSVRPLSDPFHAAQTLDELSGTRAGHSEDRHPDDEEDSGDTADAADEAEAFTGIDEEDSQDGEPQSYQPLDPFAAPAPGLYLVATPIGNLEDMTFRAVRILKASDLILAEDTRHSRVLLGHYGIARPSESYNDFNKEKRTPGYVERLKQGERISLICDAGTPGIADPAFNLVKAALAEGIKVYPVPGACALIAAVTASGLPTDRFSFENFPPKKSSQRLRKLESVKQRWGGEEQHAPTLIFYVSPHQIRQFLEEIAEVFGADMHVVLARELTKKFEEFLSDTAAKLREYYRERTPRGEYVLLLHPQNKR